MLRLLFLLALGAPPLLAAAQSNVGPDGAPPLYGCIDNAGKQRFSGLALEGCTRAASLSADWRWLGLSAAGTQANYVDLRHLTRQGDAVGVWMLALPPDSSGAALGGPENDVQFDRKAHEVIDCAAHQGWSDESLLIRNVRTAPQVERDVRRGPTAPQAIAENSVLGVVEGLVCAGGHPRAAGP